MMAMLFSLLVVLASVPFETPNGLLCAVELEA
jgi:hypothetical protein